MRALLFGHEIIIPAGEIADCPAFVELFGEIMGPSDEYCVKMSTMATARCTDRFAWLERRFDAPGG